MFLFLLLFYLQRENVNATGISLGHLSLFGLLRPFKFGRANFGYVFFLGKVGAHFKKEDCKLNRVFFFLNQINGEKNTSFVVKTKKEVD